MSFIHLEPVKCSPPQEAKTRFDALDLQQNCLIDKTATSMLLTAADGCSRQRPITWQPCVSQ